MSRIFAITVTAPSCKGSTAGTLHTERQASLEVPAAAEDRPIGAPVQEPAVSDLICWRDIGHPPELGRPDQPVRIRLTVPALSWPIEAAMMAMAEPLRVSHPGIGNTEHLAEIFAPDSLPLA